VKIASDEVLKRFYAGTTAIDGWNIYLQILRQAMEYTNRFAAPQSAHIVVLFTTLFRCVRSIIF
jgi:hypothetical protein